MTNSINHDLLKSLETGFIDQFIQSKKEYSPELLVNDPKRGKKILSTLEWELEACEEFWFSVAFVTTSGLACLMNTLIKLSERGVKGKILVSQYLNFTQPEALRRLLQFENIDLRIATKENFHSKGYLFKRGVVQDLIIGSSNLTSQALTFNKEWNLKVSATYESLLIVNALEEFSKDFESAKKVDGAFINQYEPIYLNARRNIKKVLEPTIEQEVLKPNLMQKEALKQLQLLRDDAKNKGLLISATGTGKTFLSAFDAQAFNPKRLLFVVHRERIAKDAMNTFKTVFGASKSMGLYTGSHKDQGKDFLFATIQTISQNHHLKQFEKDQFDYIIIDETHRAGADSYNRLLQYFEPKFLLGMTATPERTDGLDIFSLFDHHIAYEIRLHQALESDLLSPFHYYGVTDIEVDGRVLDDQADFQYLTSEQRVEHIIKISRRYGCDDGNVRGLVFCSRVEESQKLSDAFNAIGYKTIALSGSHSEKEREEAIRRLESDQKGEQLDYIFSVDIFNEGIDIPSVNQIIMLRPTQSAIVFVQQLGRGLRKANGKEYLTVIDFIGNYSNNYLVPIALYGDTSYNKDSIRKFMKSGSRLIPGTSTINFDEISKKRIFDAIDQQNMQLKKDLILDYDLLKYKIGRIPQRVDFIEHGSRDPQLYINYARSYFNFISAQEKDLQGVLDKDQLKLLELFDKEINNGKRIEESIILKALILDGELSIQDLKNQIAQNYHYTPTDHTLDSALWNLNFQFITENKNKKVLSVQEIYGFKVVKKEGDKILVEEQFQFHLTQPLFREDLLDGIEYAIHTFKKDYHKEYLEKGFIRYKKYSRKDVFRILNWEKNPIAQNVGGYILDSENTQLPIFVNYHKEDDISNTTKYEDHFINNEVFAWMSKSRRTMKSREIQVLQDNQDLHIPLFIKKNNDEGAEFYFMGEVIALQDSFEQTTMPDDKGGEVSVVKVQFKMNTPVEEELYRYITNS